MAGWNQVVKSTGGKTTPDGLRDKPIEPVLFASYWGIYTGILKGSERVGVLEIDTYTRLMGIELDPWEVNLLLEMENGRRNSQSKS